MINKNTSLGQQIGNYRLVEELDCGSFGCVFRAEHILIKKRIVAIKVLHAHLASQQQQESFLQEADLLDILKHPHILPILDAGIHNGFPYLVLEYCAGGSLYSRLKQHYPNPLPVQEAVTILSMIGQALQHAHEQNVIHRDLKPENILFNAKGEALLADFGIAKMLDTIGIRQGTITGTPPYMAPEQFRGTASRASDQYALGCIAYELLTGQQPFTAPDIVTYVFKHLTEQPTAPGQLNPQLPVHVEQAILKAMAKEPEARYADVAAFIAALQKSAQQWLNEGDALFELQHYQEALAALEQALRLDSNDAITHRQQGYALNNLQRYQEALAAFEQTIHLDPNFASAYNGKGYALNNLQRYQEALAAYEQAIRLDPSFAIAYNGKGYAFLGLQRSQEALAAFEQAIRLNPNYARAYYNKGLALEQLGRKKEARQAREKAQQLGYSG